MDSEVTRFSIILTPNQTVYYPGQEITGIVNFDISCSCDIESITVHFTGKALVKWNEMRGVGKNQRRKTEQVGRETIMKVSETLFNSNETHGTETTKYGVGTYQYPFSFRLKKFNLPSSFESELGFIRYVIKARIKKPGTDDLTKQAISINDIIDPNKERYSRGDCQELREEIGFCCFTSGRVSFEARVDRGCYCPGEPIYITACAENNSSANLESLKAVLEQHVTYRNSKRRKMVVREVAELIGPKVPKKETVNWEMQPFGIPGVEPSIANCKVIKIHYVLVVKICMPHSNAASCLRFIVHMGTVPHLRSYGKPVEWGTPQYPIGAPEIYKPDKAYASPATDLFGYPDIPPPAYSSAFGKFMVNIGQEKDFNTFGNLSYIPLYVFAKIFDGSYDEAENIPGITAMSGNKSNDEENSLQVKTGKKSLAKDENNNDIPATTNGVQPFNQSSSHQEPSGTPPPGPSTAPATNVMKEPGTNALTLSAQSINDSTLSLVELAT